MQIKVRDNFPEVIAKLNGLQRDLQGKALGMALNRTASKARTEAIRAVTDEYEIKASDIRPRFVLRQAQARANRLVAELEAFGRSRGKRSMNIRYFLERSVTLAEARRRRKSGTLNDLRFRIKRGSRPKTIPGAFVGLHGLVWRRIKDTTMPSRAQSKGLKHREKIEPVSTIDLPAMFTSRKINKRVMDRVLREFPVEAENAMRAVINKWR